MLINTPDEDLCSREGSFSAYFTHCPASGPDIPMLCHKLKSKPRGHSYLLELTPTVLVSEHCDLSAITVRYDTLLKEVQDEAYRVNVNSKGFDMQSKEFTHIQYAYSVGGGHSPSKTRGVLSILELQAVPIVSKSRRDIMGDLGYPSYTTHLLYNLQETSNRQEPNTDNLHYNTVLINMKVAKEMSKYLVVTKEPETVTILVRDMAGLGIIALILTLLLRKVQVLDCTL